MPIVATLLLAASLGAAPNFSVVVTRRLNLDAASALEVAETFSTILAKKSELLGTRVSPKSLSVTLAAGGKSDTATCAGAVTCALDLGRLASIDQLFALQVVRVGKDYALDVSFLKIAERTTVATATATLPTADLRRRMEKLADDLLANAAAWQPPAPPRVVEVIPPPPPPAPAPGPVEEVRQGTMTTTRWVAVGAGALAVVSAGVWIQQWFAGKGKLEEAIALKERIDGKENLERKALLDASDASRRRAIWAGSIAGALALGAGATWFLGAPPSPAEGPSAWLAPGSAGLTWSGSW